MYGKIFSSMYEGSLYGHWQAIVTFQQFIVICDPDGIVDMTPAAIAGRTSIPLEIIEKGIEELSKPDPSSRSDDEEGRRIVLIDPTRQWGWRIVNHAYYREIIKAADKREADRERIAGKRAVSHDVADVAFQSDMSQTVANSRTSDSYADSDTKTEREGKTLSFRIPDCPKDMDAEKEYAACADYHGEQPSSPEWRSWVLRAVKSGVYAKQKTRPPTEEEIKAERRHIYEEQEARG